MPCYNEENTVEAALDMVLNAPLSIKKEIIIVNFFFIPVVFFGLV